MSKINELWTNYKKQIIIGLAAFLALIIIIIIIIVLVNVFKKYDYTSLEQLLVKTTEEYIDDHPEILPTMANPQSIVDTSSLVEGKYLKDLSKISKDNTCSAEIKINWNEDNYYIIPKLSCNSYTTPSLTEHILENETIVDNETDSGLYDINNHYTYRGEYVNNYLNFMGYSWRIIKFDTEKIYFILADTLNNKMTYVYDDRYNESISSNRGYNTFETSRIYSSLMDIYNNDLKNHHKYLLTMDACTHTRSEGDIDKSGAIECTSILQTPISLLSVYDYMNASIDQRCINSASRNCSNYNYLASTTNRWWLMNGTNENTYEVYASNQSGILNLESANAKKALRMVLAIPSDLIYKSGDGTSSNPYTFYEY